MEMEMERKETMIKMEDDPIQSSSFSRNMSSLGRGGVGVLDGEGEGEGEGDYRKSSSSSSSSLLGFVELLGIQDFTPSTFDDMLLQPSLGPTTNSSTAVAQESSEVLNTPATPNSSSISSESAANDDHDPTPKLGDENEQPHKTNKQLKVKKASNSSSGKKQEQQQGKGREKGKEQRVAFMTRSEVDHLEDGYKWRKYGQKAVKNSPFPRSYYRCTSTSCIVKKRVERCFSDPSIVVTTYEGHHIHPSPLLLSPSPNPPPPPPPASFFPHQLLQINLTSTSTTHHPPPQFFNNNNNNNNNNNILAPINMNMNYMTINTTTNTTPMNNAASSTHEHDERRFCNGDHGLLQDIVPSILRDDHHH